MTDLRLLTPALAAWAATGIAVGVPGGAVEAWPALVAAVALVVAAVLLRGRRGAPVLGLLAVTGAVVALVLTSVASSAALRHPPELGRPGAVTLIAEVAGPPVASGAVGGGERLRVLLVAAEVDGAPVAVRSPALVFFGRGDSDGRSVDHVAAPRGFDARIGARIRMEATLQPADPGDSVAWLVFASEEPRSVSGAPSILAAADALRDGMVRWSSGLPGDGGALLPGLAIGDTGAVSESLDDAMTASSLSHLTAVSGANCALVVAAAMGLAALLRLRRPVRVAVAGIALIGFVILVTPQPSVLRAAVMAAVVLLAAATGRRGTGLAALCLAVIVLLAVDPWLSRDYGFALSALATAGLLVLAAPITRGLARVMPQPLAAAVALPVAAQLACQPVLILLEPSLPMTSVVSNLLAAPAAPVATMLGLVACLTLPFAPPIGQLAGTLAWLPSAWIAAVARSFASVPALLPWLPGLGGAALLGVALMLLVAGIRARRRGLSVAGAAVILVVLASLQASAIGTALSRPHDWRVISCDVGQGAATLVRGGDAVALIDTGDDAAALKSCLADAGIATVDLLVLTHFDRDHVGAVDALRGKVGTLLIGPSDGADADRLVDGLAKAGAAVHHATTGDHGSLGDTTWSVLWPGEETAPGNAASIVLLVEGGGITSLFLGDLDEEAQASVLRGALSRVQTTSVEIVGVAHHGSADQSRALYERLSPAVALVSVGADNDYGHPAPRLLALLDSVGAKVLRTDRAGTVYLSAASGGVAVWTEEDPGRPLDDGGGG